MTRLAQLFTGSNLRARALRSSALAMGGFVASQVIRLASNLILTRLLFPEAFGMMALVMVFLQGLAMFSDVGILPAIMQSKRGDERRFLDTAWSIQVARGFILWIIAAALAWPMATIYGEPELLKLLPVAALTLVIAGFTPTKVATANRHLNLGRLTVIDVFTQLAGITSAVLLAYLTQSVWALVWSGIISALVQLGQYELLLKGPRNRLDWERPAARELIRFGKWIFLSTIAGFAFGQADKLLIGKYLPLDQFGIYNIGFFLASFPLLLGNIIIHKLLIPLYRERPPAASPANFRALRKMRFLVSGALLSMVAVLAFFGVPLIELLYDTRYYAAGGVVALIACMQVPQIIAITYDQAALAAGDSQRYFVLQALRAVFMVIGLLVGLESYGLMGALYGYGAALLCSYPVVVWLARRMRAWDPLHDLFFAILGGIMVGCALWLNSEDILQLSQMHIR